MVLVHMVNVFAERPRPRVHTCVRQVIEVPRRRPPDPIARGLGSRPAGEPQAIDLIGRAAVEAARKPKSWRSAGMNPGAPGSWSILRLRPNVMLKKMNERELIDPLEIDYTPPRT